MVKDMSSNNIDADQIAEFKECFNLYDRDNDGIISIDEMMTVMRSLSQCPSEREIKEISLALGKNKITFPKFLEYMIPMMKKQRTWENDIYEAFRLYDKDKTGLISIKDLQHILTQTGDRLNQQEFEYMLKVTGINKNATHVKYSDLSRAFKEI
ncbi:calmodulin-A isoform X2 [Hydra vulgaris]|uniref:Calmodulin-A isoform X2 n=1 Tax=Hydra vulgaris TaxID=6087 RepID=A0ABM4B5L9_HYDVU